MISLAPAADVAYMSVMRFALASPVFAVFAAIAGNYAI